MKKSVSVVIGTGFIALSSLATGATAEECMAARGKIQNNAQAGGDTLGVASLKLGKNRWKCAVAGDAQDPVPGGPNFRHTIVCNDKVGVEDPQSQITFNTYFAEEPVVTGFCPEGNPFGPVALNFVEISIPDPATARGAFVGADPALSQITITGHYNCNGGISMKFEGLMCFMPE